MTRPAPAFEAPWHAEVFALTVALNEAGHFDWTDWAAAFGATLQRRGLARELDGGDDYFSCWLETLEDMLTARVGLAPDQVEELRADWEAAYLAAPHGHPVRLADALG